MKYFAYGSNMSLLRLRERVPSAARIGMAALVEYSLRFHKWSRKDKSAKSDAFCTRNSDDRVIGALFEIPHHEKGPLDKAEGLGFGYEQKDIVAKSSQALHSQPFP